MCCRGQFVAKNACSLSERFKVGNTLFGEGGRGRVVRAYHVRTKREFALKLISKKKSGTAEYTDVEIALMKSLDHPNIAKLYETFETDDYVYLVLEACKGGALYTLKSLTEDQVARIMKQILYAVRYMHKASVLHGDLSLSNILLESISPVEENNIKIIDFGSARRSLTFSADIEACCGIMRALLGKVGTAGPRMKRGSSKGLDSTSTSSSSQPKSKVFTSSGVEVNASRDAKGLLNDLQASGSIASALCHSWFQRRTPRELNPTQARLLPDILERMKSFNQQNKFKRAVLHIIADHLPVERQRALRDLFVYLDRNSDGIITPKEVKKCLEKVYDNVPSGVTAAMRAADADDIGPLEYSAFLAAMLEKSMYEDEISCKDAFDVFDRDGNGQITQEEIAQLLCDKAVKGSMKARTISRLVQDDLDQNGDGVISFNEFLAAMRDEPSLASGIFRTKIDKARVDAMTASATPLERTAFQRMKRLSITTKANNDFVNHQGGKDRKAKTKKQKSSSLPRELTGYLTAVATAATDDDVGNLQDLVDFEDFFVGIDEFDEEEEEEEGDDDEECDFEGEGYLISMEQEDGEKYFISVCELGEKDQPMVQPHASTPILLL